MQVHFFLKIFNNIKSEHESKYLAKLELLGLFGEVQPIYNFLDTILSTPLRVFTKEPIRIQDILTHELPYGKIQGYYGTKDKIINVTKLVKRLAYTREIFMLFESNDKPEILLKQIFPGEVIDKNVQFFTKGGYVLFRFITNQYFLEKSEYISKLSRNEEEIDRNVEILFSHLMKNIYRIPASSTLSVGKRLEDYFAIREEPSLYLNHYMHPYKGKFHPKMVRALLNYIYPHDNGIILDNFAGSGTLLVEAEYLGLKSLGVEINPLSVLMSNVKCNSIRIPLEKLKMSIRKYLNMVKSEIKHLEKISSGQLLLVESKLNISKIKAEAKKLLKSLEKINKFKNRDLIIQKIIVARELLNFFQDKDLKEFLLLALSGTISDILRRKKKEFEDVLSERLKDLYLRIYLFHKLNDVLKIKIKDTKTYCADARNMYMIQTESVDGIVTSPPYSTALDYIKNDYPQLVLLRLAENIKKLEKDMIGNPRANYDKSEILKLIKDGQEDPLKISSIAHHCVSTLLNGGRQKDGLRVYKYFVDMLMALKEMYRVLKKGAKCVIIIGNNHFLIRNKYIEVKNDEIILDLAKHVGFKEDIFIKRELQKTSVGNIKTESIIILKK